MAVPSTVTAAAPASLYVGDLHPDVTDGQLVDAFSEFSSLASVRVCRDSSTGRSYGYGYVNFLSAEDATRAIEVKNRSLLNGKMMRISWSCRDPDARKSGKGNVYIKNLDESIDNVALHDLFKKFGNIISCKVATSEDGKSKGHGFVQFETEESAKAAIENLNGSTVADKQLYVGKFMRKSDRVVSGPEAKYTNLYMKNLDPDVTEGLLREKFSEFGKIVSLAVAKDENGVSKGFAFVNFDNPDDARRAMEAMNGYQLGSKNLYVARAQKKAEREQILRRTFEEKRKEQIMKYKRSNVYVKNINDDVTVEELKELFSQCGTITSAKLMLDNKGIKRGFGFVCFSTPEEATKAVNTFYGYMFHGKPLYAAIAQRKEERQAQLQLHYGQPIPGLAGHSTNVIPGGYPPLYYTAPTGVVPQVPPRPGLMYQPMGLRGGWRANGFAAPTRPPFQVAPHQVVPNNPRQNRQNRGRMSGAHAVPQAGSPSVAYMQQPTQPVVASKDSSNQQRSGQSKYVANGRVNSKAVGPVSQKPEMLNSLLAAASPDRQKQILGEHLYPLVEKHQPDLVAKITGMLLEMDNSELLLLLESPESLAAKVEEAVQVLKLSQAKVSGQDAAAAALHSSNFLSAEVAVN